jgi:malate dehydrogenase (oxaloacetate-decarboxylating)
MGVAKGLIVAGNKNIVLCDRHGALRVYRTVGMDWAKSEIARLVGPQDVKGSLAEVIKGADVFIGLSGPGLVTPEMIASMARDPIVFALALPEPEISEAEAKAAGAAVVATGLADCANQIRSSLVTPGFFRGCLDVGANQVNIDMYLAAARALANIIPEDKVSPTQIIPRQMDWQISPVLARAVAGAAQQTGVAGIGPEEMSPDKVYERTERYIYEGELAWLPSEGQDYGKLSINEESLELHRRYQGCIGIYAKVPIKDEVIYKKLYSPRVVADVCEKIRQDPLAAYDYTCKNNLVAIVTDGSAVLGLGNIGPRAALPVMEGKAILFKTFGGVEAFPICISTQESDLVVRLVENIAPAFGGINLEDISSPRCFEIEQKLRESLDIPVFHDDQHGTAIVVAAALINAVKISGRPLSEVKVVVNGAGAAAIAVSKLLLELGLTQIVLCDSRGAIYRGRAEGMNWIKEEMAGCTNPDCLAGDLGRVVKGADVFIGLSVAGALSPEMVRAMAPQPIIFALANPNPEIHPEAAREAGALVVATGRSDFPNQVNNSLVFPGVFRGALDVRARMINEPMKIAAARAIADLVPEKDLGPECIVPKSMDFQVPARVAAAVAGSAIETGVARLLLDPEFIARQTLTLIYEGDLGHMTGDRLVLESAR